MKATLIGKENNVAEFDMQFSAEEFEKKVNSVYLANKSKYTVDGFRKGKAPRKVLEAKFGKGIFYEDAMNEMIADAYPEAVGELSLRPVARPHVEVKSFEEGKDLTIGIKVAVRPEFTPGKYKGVEIDKIEYTITDEDVQKELESLQERNSRAVSVERPAKEGDTLKIDYEGFCGEEQFEGGTAADQNLTLGSNTFIPGFEDQLIGANVGDKVDVKVTFPQEYHAENLAGKDAVFHVTVKEIKETEKPVLDDEFAKDVSEFDTLEELKADLRAKLEKDSANKVEYDTKNAIIEKIYEATEIDIPDDMVENQVMEMMDELDMQLKYQGITVADYLKYMGKTPEQFKEEIRPDAYKKMKTRLIIDEIANLENIEASQEEIDAEIQGIADHYKIPVESIKEQFETENLELIVQDIRNRKAIQLLLDEAVIK